MPVQQYQPFHRNFHAFPWKQLVLNVQKNAAVTEINRLPNVLKTAFQQTVSNHFSKGKPRVRDRRSSIFTHPKKMRARSHFDHTPFGPRQTPQLLPDRPALTP